MPDDVEALHTEPRLLGDYEWEDELSPDELSEALQGAQQRAVYLIVDALLRDLAGTGRVLPHAKAKAVLGTLRQYTFFSEMEAVASAILKNEPGSLVAGRQHAQALIENKKCTEAIRELTALSQRATSDAESTDLTVKQRAQEELPELSGLLGRAYKQLYIDAAPNMVEPRTHDLEKAIEHYQRVYEKEPNQNYWHGGNWIALLSHAEKVKRGNPKELSAQAKRLARDLLDQIADDKRLWAAGTRIEAYLALGETTKAVEAAQQFLAHPDVNRFAIAATLRQLRELWCLSSKEPPGSNLIPIFEVTIAQRGGAITIASPATETERFYARKQELQHVWGNVSYQPVDWLEKALARTRSVARIGTSAFSGAGTGFLVSGASIAPNLATLPLLLTNAHVCSSDVAVQQLTNALDPKAARVVFLGSKDTQVFTVKELFTSPPHELDFTLLELSGTPPEGTEVLVPADELSVAAGAHVNVIGHPHGAKMQVSVQDNDVVECDDKYVWYRSPTDPGHSGSPVFDNDWRLVAIHHASRSQKRANEGIRIDRVVAALRTRGLSEKHESMSVVADGAATRSPWDAAHARAHEENQYVEPDFRQSVPQPEIQHEGAARSTLGLNRFWPPKDEQYHFAWHLAEEFSQLRKARTVIGDPGENRIRVGILDTGYDPDHVSLPRYTNLALARNVTGQGDPFDARDPNDSGWFNNPGHGTATLALLAGNEISHPDFPEGSDYIGGAPFMEVVPIRVADSVVHLRTNALAEGLEHAIQIGCRVVSISMGGVPNKRWAAAVNAAYERGVVVVAAAGNRFGPSPPVTLVYPARFRRVIGVCGVCHDRTPYYRDQPHLEMQGCFGPDSRMKAGVIAAFTANMSWAIRGSRDKFALDGAGTSAATPQVAAAAALWLQKYAPVLPTNEPWRCVEAVRHALFTSADTSVAEYPHLFGAGILRAANALEVPYNAALEMSPPAELSFPWLRLLTGLEGKASEHTRAMLEAEALQTYAASPKLQEAAGYADPEDELDADKRKALFTEMVRQAIISHQLRQHLEAGLR